MSELRALTGARGLAAWFVVLYHIRSAMPWLPEWTRGLLAKGYLAVDFFFLLSGFVIWLAWSQRLREPGAVAKFLRRRVARIWPLHLVMLAFALALAIALRATGRIDTGFPLSELPLHVLLVQNWGFTDALAWNDPAWSISAEAAAYLAFPLLALAVDWRRLPTPALLAIAAAMLLALHLAMRGADGLGDSITRFGALRCLAEFGVGGIVAALWLRRPVAAGPALVAAALLAARFAGAPETLVVPAAFAAALLALAATAGRPGNPLEGRALHRLGAISYATYLGHFLLWKAFKLPLADAADVPPWQIAGYLLLVLVASAWLYDRVELPAQAWLNRSRRAAPLGPLPR